MINEFRFLLASDLNLDGNFSHLGSFTAAMRKYSLQVFKNILNIAEKEDVNALLIAGNLFNSSLIQDETLKIITSELNRISPMKVFISPGHLDPYNPGSPYFQCSWSPNVHIFNKGEFTPVEVPQYGVTLYGFAHTHHEVTESPFRNIKDLNKSSLNILLFQGSLQDQDYSFHGEYAPFTIDQLIKINSAFAAVGSCRRFQILKRKDNNNIIGCYPGLPQGSSFLDYGERGAALIHIKDNKAAIKFIPASILTFFNIEIDCNNYKNTKDITRKIIEILDKKKYQENPVRFVLKGIYKGDSLNLNEIKKEIYGKSVYMELSDETLNEYDIENLKDEISIRGIFVKQMQSKIQQTPAAKQEEREILDLAMKYGLDSFSREEVRKRWL